MFSIDNVDDDDDYMLDPYMGFWIFVDDFLREWILATSVVPWVILKVVVLPLVLRYGSQFSLFGVQSFFIFYLFAYCE